MTFRVWHVRALTLVCALSVAFVFFVNAAVNGMNGAPMHDPMVGGAAMYPNKTIVQNAAASKDHTTLVTAIKAAGLVPTLGGSGPFTVFAPTNEAFAKLPPEAVASLLKPANKATLIKVLTYHVIAGKLSAMAIESKIAAGGGKATLTTIEGGPLTASMRNGKLTLTDVKGDTATVTIANVYQSNGVIHVVDTVLMP